MTGGNCILNMHVCPDDRQLTHLSVPSYLLLGIPPDIDVIVYTIELFAGAGIPGNYLTVVHNASFVLSTYCKYQQITFLYYVVDRVNYNCQSFPTIKYYLVRTMHTDILNSMQIVTVLGELQSLSPVMIVSHTNCCTYWYSKSKTEFSFSVYVCIHQFKQMFYRKYKTIVTVHSVNGTVIEYSGLDLCI